MTKSELRALAASATRDNPVTVIPPLTVDQAIERERMVSARLRAAHNDFERGIRPHKEDLDDGILAGHENEDRLGLGPENWS